MYCFVDDGDEYSNAGDDPEILTGAGEVVIVEKQPVMFVLVEESILTGYELFDIFADYKPM